MKEIDSLYMFISQAVCCVPVRQNCLVSVLLRCRRLLHLFLKDCEQKGTCGKINNWAAFIILSLFKDKWVCEMYFLELWWWRSHNFTTKI